MKMAQLRQNRQPKLMEQSEISLKKLPRKKQKWSNKGDYYSIQGKYDEIIVANKHYPLSQDYNPGENPTAKQSWSNSSKRCKRQVSQSATITVVLEVMKLRLSSIKIMSIKMGKKLPTVILPVLAIANTKLAWPLMLLGQMVIW